MKSSNIEQSLKALNNTIVVIKPLSYLGQYLDSHDSYIAHITECPNSKLFHKDSLWTRWIIHYLHENCICLESVRYPDHYLDVHNDSVRITYSPDIPLETLEGIWSRFRVFGDNLSNVSIQSERNEKRWLKAYKSSLIVAPCYHDLEDVPQEEGTRFKIQFPAEILDEYSPVASYHNDTNDEVSVEYRYSIGTESKTVEISQHTATFSIEIQRNFSIDIKELISISSGFKFGATYSNMWRHEKADTFTQSKTVTADVKIKPGEVVTIKQLIGKYGDFTVHSSIGLEITNSDLTNNLLDSNLQKVSNLPHVVLV
ncbi:MAG: hypothetical protein QNJ33_19470 [Crocosphaera sp.]|nr:hypothetical protein [Crocosphaera sp.]